MFSSIDHFYREFDVYVGRFTFLEGELSDFDANSYLKEFPFYSFGDRRFRYIRDVVLGQDEFRKVMRGMMEEIGVSLEYLAQELWMQDSHIYQLSQGDMI